MTPFISWKWNWSKSKKHTTSICLTILTVPSDTPQQPLATTTAVSSIRPKSPLKPDSLHPLITKTNPSTTNQPSTTIINTETNTKTNKYWWKNTKLSTLNTHNHLKATMTTMSRYQWQWKTKVPSKLNKQTKPNLLQTPTNPSNTHPSLNTKNLNKPNNPSRPNPSPTQLPNSSSPSLLCTYPLIQVTPRRQNKNHHETKNHHHLQNHRSLLQKNQKSQSLQPYCRGNTSV